MDPSHPRTLWHASRADIDRPTIAGRTVGDNHENSGLGIFCATRPADYIAGFGEVVHALTLVPNAKAMRISIGDLASMGRRPGALPWTREEFEAEGRRLAQDYDIIELVEICGAIEQAIILRDTAIAACRKMSQDEFLAVSASHSPATTRRPGPARV